MTAALEVVSGQHHASAALYSQGRAGTHFTVGWVCPRAGLDERKISYAPGFDPGPSGSHSVAIPTELPGPRITNVFTDIRNVNFQNANSKPYFYTNSFMFLYFL